MNSSVVAVICEVNPFHSGHAFLFRRAREMAGPEGVVVAVMSGNFVQRAMPAVFDKYTRARALLGGMADIVIELPFPWCSGSAEYFAGAGVYLASVVHADYLMFGTSTGDLSELRTASDVLRSEAFRSAVKSSFKQSKDGDAVMREHLLRELAPECSSGLLSSPNDILAVSYLPYCDRYSVQPIPVSRQEGEGYLSATQLRDIMREDFDRCMSLLPAEGASEYRNALQEGLGPVSEQECLQLLFQTFALAGDRMLPAAESIGGLGNRLISKARESADAEDFFKRAATKKYTNARIRRALLYAVCGVTGDLLKVRPSHALALGFNRRGRALLADRANKDGFEVFVTPSAMAKCKEIPELSAVNKAELLYGLCMPNKRNAGYFKRHQPELFL